MKQKKLYLEKGVLIFYFYDNSKDLNSYKKEGILYPIKLLFIPKIEMTELNFEEYIDKQMRQIFDILNSIILENNIFYENFELNLNKKFTSFCFYRSKVKRDVLLLSNAMMKFEHKLN